MWLGLKTDRGVDRRHHAKRGAFSLALAVGISITTLACGDDSALTLGTYLTQAQLPGQPVDAATPEREPSVLEQTVPGQFSLEDGPRRSILGEVGARTPTIEEGRFRLPQLIAPTTATAEIGNGRLPDGFRGEDSFPVELLPESAADRGFGPEWIVRPWAAPNTFSNPLYFEDRMLERHGHERWGHFQHVASGVRFATSVVMLPYLMTLQPPAECEYSLGYFPSGSPTPVLWQRPPYERRAAIVEAGAVAGGFLALP